MPAFVFLLLLSLLGWTNVTLLFSLDKPVAALLVSLLALQISHLTWAFRPEKAPRAASVSPEVTFEEAWAECVALLLTPEGPVEFVTLPALPQFTEPHVAKFCEDLTDEGKPCADCLADCNCDACWNLRKDCGCGSGAPEAECCDLMWNEGEAWVHAALPSTPATKSV